MSIDSHRRSQQAAESEAAGGNPSRRRYLPLLQRVAVINTLLLLAAVGATILILVPGHESTYRIDEEGIALFAAVVLVVLVNVLLLRRVVRPVQHLTAIARTVDLTRPTPVVPDATPSSEAGELALTFNQMLERLRADRREATGRVLAGQEAERLRIAQELHDQVGQELTGVLLGLARVSSQTPACLQDDVSALQDLVRDSLDDVRRIALELRPDELDDLGLPSALAVLSERFAEQGDLEISESIAGDLPARPADTELVVYRVAQEAITNVARHSASNRAELALAYREGHLVLRVRDYGLGLAPGEPAGTGMRGMGERAALIGAELTIANAQPGPGCEVRLDIPIRGPLQC